MQNKWQLIRKLGMVEARRRGLADQWDQLLFAARDLANELKRTDGIAQQDDAQGYSISTALGYMLATLKEFKGDR